MHHVHDHGSGGRNTNNSSAAAAGGLEPYVVLPFKRWKTLDEQAKSIGGHASAVPLNQVLPDATIGSTTGSSTAAESGESKSEAGAERENNSTDVKAVESENTESSAEQAESSDQMKSQSKSKKSDKKGAAKQKDLSKTHASLHIQKQLNYLTQRGHFDKKKFPNLSALVQNAMGQGKAQLPHEKEFYTYLFTHHLGHFVRNRSKIAKYYHIKDWFVI